MGLIIVYVERNPPFSRKVGSLAVRIPVVRPPSSPPHAHHETQEGPKFQLSIQTQVLKCMETGGYVAPDPVAFKSFASCEADMEEDGKDDCDLSIFVITPDSTDEDSGNHHAAGINMVWIDSESSTGYSVKHIIEGDPRFDAKRAVYIEANKVWVDVEKERNALYRTTKNCRRRLRSRRFFSRACVCLRPNQAYGRRATHSQTEQSGYRRTCRARASCIGTAGLADRTRIHVPAPPLDV